MAIRHADRQQALVHLLTTSRKALRAEGETVHLLQPLDSPVEDGDLTAVQLFVERAFAGGYASALTDA